MIATRRSFLAGSGVVLLGCAAHAYGAAPAEEAVTPAEDLMREHGVLRRVMYLYDEAIARFGAGRDVPLDALAGGASVIRRVIEDYHEQLEEQHVFPELERADELVELTTVLRAQHEVGRALTDRVLALAKAPRADADRAALATTLRAFNHMYRAHAAREDTVLFPALRGLVGGAAYAELGEQLEAKETELLGADGFERAVAEVATLEEAFGVDDLAKLTPTV